ncbi:hypothetical protein ES319_A06G040200v1 [Gossypium barbadense]|uniref:Uncharacterized protein n=2 Tax=Gossypium TaxID=3633 RepID=A0A5J5V9T5_GOSBA|nr:hypothetical protein ES319_A06G040200v1 [Gossypium barbadense]TYH12132.1 hypothetical protein ES288_A06G041700v1 [Gossypium darwinii]
MQKEPFGSRSSFDSAFRRIPKDSTVFQARGDIYSGSKGRDGGQRRWKLHPCHFGETMAREVVPKLRIR